ncbi:MAG: SpoIIE family protein phosphatase [Spirochaetota bacterium]
MKKIEKKAIYFKLKYQKIFDHMGEAVFVLDASGIIREVNPKATTLFNIPVVGKKISEIFRGEHPQLSSLVSAGIIQSVHGYATTCRKENHPFLLTFVPVSEDEIIVIGQDMDEIYSIKAEIERLGDRIKAFEEERRLRSKLTGRKYSTSSIAQAMRNLQIANLKLEEINRNLTRELGLAALLQKSLIPASVKDDRFLQFAFHYEPMEIIGGDYYDVIDFGDSKKGVFIADVSGHGVSSALIAAMLKISFLNYSAKEASPAEVMNMLNREYCNVIQTGDYVTAFYCIFDCVHNSITYCSAGHPRPLILRARKGKVEFLSSEGFFIGMLNDVIYTDEFDDFNEGDRAIIFTDGIVEAYSDESGEQFGEQRLLESFRKNSNQSLDQMISSIIMDVKGFMQKSKFYDDLAMVAVEYRKR